MKLNGEIWHKRKLDTDLFTAGLEKLIAGMVATPVDITRSGDKKFTGFLSNLDDILGVGLPCNFEKIRSAVRAVGRPIDTRVDLMHCAAGLSYGIAYTSVTGKARGNFYEVACAAAMDDSLSAELIHVFLDVVPYCPRVQAKGFKPYKKPKVTTVKRIRRRTQEEIDLDDERIAAASNLVIEGDEIEENDEADLDEQLPAKLEESECQAEKQTLILSQFFVKFYVQILRLAGCNLKQFIASGKAVKIAMGLEESIESSPNLNTWKSRVESIASMIPFECEYSYCF